MALLGDDQAAGVRRHMVNVGEFTAVEAFPQKDNPNKRVFHDAKLSTTVFSYVKRSQKADNRPFRSRYWKANVIEAQPLGELTLTTADIPLYDPNNFAIVSCAQADWDVAVKLMKSGRLARLGAYAEFSQGEVNETNERKNGTLVAAGTGKLVTRGASVCLYVTRTASQGENLYLDVAAFTADKDESTKAFHHLNARVGWQESSPQNNFRRIIAAQIPAGEFCNHTVNYLPEPDSKLPLAFVVALLNSVLADWYFRLGSTNNHVSHYQLKNLPCPVFRDRATAAERGTAEKAIAELVANKPSVALVALSPLLQTAPFSAAVQGVVAAAVDRIICAEADREDMKRAERSELCKAAQPFQDFLDTVFFRLAGLTDPEVAALKKRYQAMKKVK
jgi:hypothetical protein